MTPIRENDKSEEVNTKYVKSERLISLNRNYLSMLMNGISECADALEMDLQ
jgi:hypothetical protein